MQRFFPLYHFRKYDLFQAVLIVYNECFEKVLLFH